MLESGIAFSLTSSTFFLRLGLNPWDFGQRNMICFGQLRSSGFLKLVRRSKGTIDRVELRKLASRFDQLAENKSRKRTIKFAGDRPFQIVSPKTYRIGEDTFRQHKLSRKANRRLAATK